MIADEQNWPPSGNFESKVSFDSAKVETEGQANQQLDGAIHNINSILPGFGSSTHQDARFLGFRSLEPLHHLLANRRRSLWPPQ